MSVIIELLSSIVATTIATCIVFPGQRIKLEMHLDNEKNLKNTKQAISQIYRRHGLTGFYQGLIAQIVGNGVSYAVYFVVYAKAKEIYGFDPESAWSTIKSSGSAGCISSIMTNPFWVLKTLQAKKHKSIGESAKELIREEGFFALWKGVTLSLILVSNPIIQFVIYQWLKKNALLEEQHIFFDLMIFIFGAISKIVTTLITYPYTFIRTRQHSSKIKISMRDVLKSQIQKNGIFGLYSGLNAKLIQTVLNSAILLMLFERTHIILTKLLK